MFFLYRFHIFGGKDKLNKRNDKGNKNIFIFTLYITLVLFSANDNLNQRNRK